MRKIMSCGVLIVRGDPIQQFLLMEHSDRLDLPKGHVDRGETEMECALRELEEETGIRLHDIEIDQRFRFEHQYRVWPKKWKGEECEKTLVIFLVGSYAKWKSPLPSTKAMLGMIGTHHIRSRPKQLIRCFGRCLSLCSIIETSPASLSRKSSARKGNE